MENVMDESGNMIYTDFQQFYPWYRAIISDLEIDALPEGATERQFAIVDSYKYLCILVDETQSEDALVGVAWSRMSGSLTGDPRQGKGEQTVQEIQFVFMVPAYRGQGHCNQLVSEMIKFLSDSDENTIYVHAFDGTTSGYSALAARKCYVKAALGNGYTVYNYDNLETPVTNCNSVTTEGASYLFTKDPLDVSIEVTPSRGDYRHLDERTLEEAGHPVHRKPPSGSRLSLCLGQLCGLRRGGNKRKIKRTKKRNKIKKRKTTKRKKSKRKKTKTRRKTPKRKKTRRR